MVFDVALRHASKRASKHASTSCNLNFLEFIVSETEYLLGSNELLTF